jgi:hypothetical protein
MISITLITTCFYLVIEKLIKSEDHKSETIYKMNNVHSLLYESTIIVLEFYYN